MVHFSACNIPFRSTVSPEDFYHVSTLDPLTIFTTACNVIVKIYHNLFRPPLSCYLYCYYKQYCNKYPCSFFLMHNEELSLSVILLETFHPPPPHPHKHCLKGSLEQAKCLAAPSKSGMSCTPEGWGF